MGKSGYLYKEGANVQSWKKRWFVLENGIVKYFKDEKSSKLIKEFRIINAELNAPSTLEEARKKPKQFVFTISASPDLQSSLESSTSGLLSESRVFFLAASSQAEKIEWQRAFEDEGAYHAPIDYDKDLIEKYDTGTSELSESADGDTSPVPSNDKGLVPLNVSVLKAECGSSPPASPSLKIDSPTRRVAAQPSDIDDSTANSKKGRWRCLHTFSGHSAAVSAMVVPREVPDDPRLRLLFTGSADKTVKIWNYEQKSLLSTLKASKPVSSLVYAEQEKVVLCASGQDKTIRGWELGPDLSGSSSFGLESGQNPVTVLAVCSSKSMLASADTKKEIRLWDIPQRKCVATFNGNNAKIIGLEVLEQDQQLLSASEDGVIKIWDLRKTGECIATVEPSGAAISHIAVGEIEKAVFTSCVDNSIKIRDFRNDFFFKDYHCVDGVRFADCSGLCTCELPQAAPPVTEQQTITVGGRQRKIANVIPVSQLTPYSTQSSHTYVIASSEKNIKFWDYEVRFSSKGKEIEMSWDCSLRAHDANITALLGTRAFSMSDVRLFTASLDKTVKMWGNLYTPDSPTVV